MVDRQNREGVRFGGGAPASDAQQSRARRDRLRQLALETFDVTKDPYLARNHVGSLECRLCTTVHATEGSYMAHTMGKRHQQALQRRAERDAKLNTNIARLLPNARAPVRKSLKIGRPGYKVTKFFLGGNDEQSKGLEFELHFPDIEPGMQPRHSFMSAFEQRIEPSDKRFQYLLFAAHPYETVGFKLPNEPVDKHQFSTQWDKDSKIFRLKLVFKPSQ
ncbi:hypothetical protein BASA81_008055 [Batrachochytrium salamandrivorans]|nr:hypothetical protein BASA81_008055 [Batrachochytrium salamandrivorans]